MPSVSIFFAGVVLEIPLCGTPVIACRYGGMIHVMEPIENRIQVSVPTATGLAQALEGLARKLSCPRELPGDAAGSVWPR